MLTSHPTRYIFLIRTHNSKEIKPIFFTVLLKTIAGFCAAAEDVIATGFKRVNPFTADPVKALHFAILV